MRAISIHALLAESDGCQRPCAHPTKDFYPRSPCGERRRRSVKLFRQNYISIHALLAESDKRGETDANSQQEFLSTLSLRRATRFGRPIDVQLVFLSTLSLRRATWLRCWQLAARDISIHALLAESDPLWPSYRCATCISIHALLAESD